MTFETPLPAIDPRRAWAGGRCLFLQPNDSARLQFTSSVGHRSGFLGGTSAVRSGDAGARPTLNDRLHVFIEPQCDALDDLRDDISEPPNPPCLSTCAVHADKPTHGCSWWIHNRIVQNTR